MQEWVFQKNVDLTFFLASTHVKIVPADVIPSLQAFDAWQPAEARDHCVSTRHTQ